MEKVNTRATKYLKSLPRIGDLSEPIRFDGDVLNLPKGVDIDVLESSNVRLFGFDPGKDSKAKDLLRIIEVKDALDAKYIEENFCKEQEK